MANLTFNYDTKTGNTIIRLGEAAFYLCGVDIHTWRPTEISHLDIYITASEGEGYELPDLPHQTTDRPSQNMLVRAIQEELLQYITDHAKIKTGFTLFGFDFGAKRQPAVTFEKLRYAAALYNNLQNGLSVTESVWTTFKAAASRWSGDDTLSPQHPWPEGKFGACMIRIAQAACPRAYATYEIKHREEIAQKMAHASPYGPL